MSSHVCPPSVDRLRPRLPRYIVSAVGFIATVVGHANDDGFSVVTSDHVSPRSVLRISLTFCAVLSRKATKRLVAPGKTAMRVSGTMSVMPPTMRCFVQ